jgi:adenylate cyclase class 2
MKHRRENEIKLQVYDPKQLRRLVSQLNFKVLKARHFESNRVFDFPDLRLRRSRSLLRLRFAGGEAILTFKGPPLRSRQYKTRREVETGVEDGILMQEILKNLGMKQVFLYEKYRTIYVEEGRADSHESPLLVYDETPIGDYVELEGPEDWIDTVASRLGYPRKDYITSSYLTLYFERCREEGRKPGNMVFKRHAGARQKS